MSGTELLVIVLGLFIGYWVVSRFGSGNKGQEELRRKQAGPDPEVQRQREQTERQAQEQQREEQRQRQTEAAYPTSWHKVLNVSQSADIQEIRRAYKSLMSQYHPDKVASMGPELRELCERKTKEINTAYDRAMAERKAV